MKKVIALIAFSAALSGCNVDTLPEDVFIDASNGAIPSVSDVQYGHYKVPAYAYSDAYITDETDTETLAVELHEAVDQFLSECAEADGPKRAGFIISSDDCLTRANIIFDVGTGQTPESPTYVSKGGF